MHALHDTGKVWAGQRGKPKNLHGQTAGRNRNQIKPGRYKSPYVNIASAITPTASLMNVSREWVRISAIRVMSWPPEISVLSLCSHFSGGL
jgi:hypothetical protein